MFALLAFFDTRFDSDSSPLDSYTVITIPPAARHPQERIIWYHLRRTVPEIRPDRPFGPLKKPAGEKTQADQILIARSPKTESKQQLIRRPDHPEPLPVDVPAPNLVTLHLNDAPVTPKPPKVFVPPVPSPAPRLPHATLALSSPPPALDASQLQSPSDFSVPPLAQKRLPKFFVPPAPRANGSGSVPHASIPQDLPAPPEVGSQANSAAGAQAVILGLNPQAAIPPPGSRNGQFAKAPTAGPASSGNASSADAAIVPGVYAHGAPGLPPDPAAAAAASSGANMPDRRLVKILALPTVNRTMSAPLRPSSRIVPATVEAQFANRSLYTLVIPGPQLPNYPGDWVMWFAERQPESDSSPRISAPVPARKLSRVDDAPPPASPPVSATLQFSAVIDQSGRLTLPKILRGRASELFKHRALEEMETWEFMPALRNGVPIDVDVVLEVPFELRIPPIEAH